MTNDQVLKITPYLVSYLARQDQARGFTQPSKLTREAVSYYFTQQRIPPATARLKQQISQAQELTDPALAAARLAELSAELEKLEALANGNL